MHVVYQEKVLSAISIKSNRGHQLQITTVVIIFAIGTARFASREISRTFFAVLNLRNRCFHYVSMSLFEAFKCLFHSAQKTQQTFLISKGLLQLNVHIACGLALIIHHILLLLLLLFTYVLGQSTSQTGCLKFHIDLEHVDFGIVNAVLFCSSICRSRSIATLYNDIVFIFTIDCSFKS